MRLIERVSKTEVGLLAQPEYTFKAKAGENASHFVIDYEVMK